MNSSIESENAVATHNTPPPSGAVVYVFQRPRPKDDWSPDLSSAAKFGRLQFLFDIHDTPYKDPRGAAKKIGPQLRHFNPECDYLLWTNFCDPMSAWLVVFLLGIAGHHKLQFLYWQKGSIGQGSGFYYPVTLDLTH